MILLEAAPPVEIVPPNVSEVFSEKGINSMKDFFIDVLNNFLAFLPNILIAIVILIVGILLSKLVLKFMSKGLKKGKIEPTVIHFMGSLIKILLYIFVFSIVLSVLGVPTASLVAVVGAAGLAIGLALQNSLSNLAGGFIILFAKPFKIGDYIETPDGAGTVEKISILYTMLATVDNKVVFIPNGVVSGARVVNYSTKDTRRVDLTFSISYDDDHDKAIKLISDIALNHRLALKDPVPFVRMVEHSKSSIDIVARVWTSTGDYWDLYFDLIEQVRNSFKENSIEIPYDKVDVHIINQK